MEDKLMQWRTDSLTMLTKQYPSLEEFVQKTIQFHKCQYRVALKKYKPHEVAYNYIMNVENLLVDHMEKHKELSSQITCGKGCGGCCRMHTIVSIDEARLLVELCDDMDLKLSKEYLESQVAGKDVKSWRGQENKDCIFLKKDRSCIVYEYRPIACRKCFSLEDPDKCDIDKNPHGQIKRFASPEVEAVASAIMNATECDSMPRMLLKAMEERDDK